MDVRSLQTKLLFINVEANILARCPIFRTTRTILFSGSRNSIWIFTGGHPLPVKEKTTDLFYLWEVC